MDDVRQRKITRILELGVGHAGTLVDGSQKLQCNYTMTIPEIYTKFNLFLKLKK